MYYIFETEIFEWDKQSLRASIVNYSKVHTYLQEQWWYGQKIDTPIPKFVFEFNESAPTPDNYWTGTLFNLYSRKLIEIFINLRIQYEVFPAKIISRETKKPLMYDYGVFRLLEVDNVIDNEKSTFVTSMIGGYSINRLRKLILLKEFSNQVKLITRIRNYENITIVHEELKNILEENNITGCSYVPLYENMHEFEIF